MKTEDYDLEEIRTPELKKINGGIIGTACAIVGLALTATVAYGYYEGKQDCPPPPCTEG
jgi:lactobin A/cerein 7B family class IIb bacteriocin